MQQNRGRPKKQSTRVFDSAHFANLAQYLRVVMPDLSHRDMENLCSQVAAWLYISTHPRGQSAMLEELKEMGVNVIPTPGSPLGIFNVKLGDSNDRPCDSASPA